MSQTIRAIYENGVLRPLDALSLGEHEQVRLTVESDVASSDSTSTGPSPDDPLAGLRVATGISDLAENFDEYR